jgi:hypothetical protein
VKTIKRVEKKRVVNLDEFYADVADVEEQNSGSEIESSDSESDSDDSVAE